MMQNRKLKQLVGHAYHHVPFYRQQFEKNNLHPEDIRTVDDLYKIPIIDKDDLGRHPLSYYLDNHLKNANNLKHISTSGSSGKVLEFLIDPQYDQLRKAQFLRPYLTNNSSLRSHALWFRGNPENKRKLHQKLGFLRDRQYYSGLNPEEQISIIQQVKPKTMRGYGSTFQLIASKILEKQIHVPSPQVIFTDSEMLSKTSRKKIKSAFQTDVIDIYGTFETDNIAYECGQHSGYHIAVDCVIMEFIKNGRPVKAGEEGEIVCTVLDNRTFPFIRYNLHDMGTPLDTSCSCGRTFPLMGPISGRTHLFVKKKDGSKISSTSFIAHFWTKGKYIHEFQIIQKAMDHFLVLIVPTKLYSQKIEKKITDHMHKDFPYANVKICRMDRIPREKSGKLLDFKTDLKE